MSLKSLEGTVKRHPDGFGFFVPDDNDHPDVYIPRQSMNGAMTNDRVEVSVRPEPGGDRFRGDVLKIVDRAHKEVIGRFQWINPGEGILVDESHGWGADLKISLRDSRGAKDGDMVIAEISQYPEGRKKFEGKVKEILGTMEDPAVDIKRVLHGHGIETDFPEAVIRAVDKFPEEVDPDQELGRRKDLRHLNFVTIDGVTAKDFDDAIVVEQNAEGFRLWVSIADVSHYVEQDTDLDDEAYRRGNSTYFPGFVVPMLPEKLSNGLCSLNPHVPRMTMTAEIQFDWTGQAQSKKIYESIIESKKRVTYGQAQEMIDGEDLEGFEHVKDMILIAADLAKILLAKRMKEGSLDLEVPETEVIIDELGQPIDLIKSERIFAHRLIEEMMLSANVAVAEFFLEKEVDAVYRTHEPPRAEKMEMLQRFIENFGGDKKLSGGKSQKKISRALKSIEDPNRAQVLNILTLRSMNQAVYTAENSGHYGLGFDNYTHFTSPIRRYSDLIVHRVLKKVIYGDGKNYSFENLSSISTHISATEQSSVKAEREFVSIKKARFMLPYVGQDFDGVITSVTKFGIFVTLNKFDVDGLIHVDNLFQEGSEFDPENLRLVGRKSGFAYEIGQEISVVVEEVDISSGQIDFALIEELKRLKKKEKAGKKPSSSRGGAKKKTSPRKKASKSTKKTKKKTKKVRKKKKRR